MDPATIDWVLLTHAHIDHTGYLPRLVGAAYHGPIYSNAATNELCQLLLPDSAHLQEEDAQFAARKGYSSHKPPLPLYTVAEAQQALNAVQGNSARRLRSPSVPQFSVRPHDAGHILGFDVAGIDHHRKRKENPRGFLRRHRPLRSTDPEGSRASAARDFLLCESTYGDRDHPPASVPDELADVINRVAKRGGMVVIPSFAVGRTQTLMYYLRELDDQKRIPQLPVYVDSPMAISVTDIYAAASRGSRSGLYESRTTGRSRSAESSGRAHDARRRGFQENQRRRFPLHHYFRQRHGHRRAHSASPHQAAARIRAAQFCWWAIRRKEPPAARCRMARKFVRIYGQEVPVRAEIVTLDQLSAHAGRSELLRWLSGFTAPPRQTFLVHGEPNALEGLRAGIDGRYHWPVVVPSYLQSFDLNT